MMLEGEVTGRPELTALESRLSIDLSDLEGELAQHADFYYRASLEAARCEARVEVAELEVRAAMNRQTGFLRDQTQGASIPLTEAQIDARARQSSDVDKAERGAAEARRQSGVARALEAAYVARGQALMAASRLTGRGKPRA
jgi:hypothetical protein